MRVHTKAAERDITFANGCPPDLIARSQDYIAYRAGQPALALLDIDNKGMPPKSGSASRIWRILAGVGVGPA